MADAVVVAVRGELVLGYVTCKLDREAHNGSIEMVATREGERGRGIAMTCTCAALDWFRSQSTQVVEVGTQFRNIAASRLYEKCGFRLIANSLTLRKVF
jgi:ribosomal protein S18 acetylase RimI-like enzyme